MKLKLLAFMLLALLPAAPGTAQVSLIKFDNASGQWVETTISEATHFGTAKNFNDNPNKRISVDTYHFSVMTQVVDQLSEQPDMSFINNSISENAAAIEAVQTSTQESMDRAKLLADAANSNSQAALGTAMEAETRADSAYSAAENAQTLANQNKTRLDQLMTDAENIGGISETANTAQSTANSALTNSQTAATAAGQAQATAQSAQTLASQNEARITQLANDAQSITRMSDTVSAAQTAANEAVAIATSVRSTVETTAQSAAAAQETATQANAAAGQASETADRAQQKADDAFNIADAALTGVQSLDQRMDAFESGGTTAVIARAQSNTARIEALEGRLDAGLSDLENGIAMAIAMASAPVLYGGKYGFSVSGGFGNYKDKTAFSVKTAWTPNSRFGINASVASDLDGQFAFGGGAGFSF